MSTIQSCCPVKIYNGTNHQISVYKMEDCLQNRHGQYFIKSPAAVPVCTYVQQQPLSVTTQKVGGFNIGPIWCYPTDLVTKPLDIPIGALWYDMIIVSSIYAEYARLTLANYPAYLDRLYTPITVYSSDPHATMASKVGTVGFKKPYFIYGPQDYIFMLQRGEQPSIFSIASMINVYKCTSYAMDYTTSIYLQELKKYLDNFSRTTAISG